MRNTLLMWEFGDKIFVIFLSGVPSYSTNNMTISKRKANCWQCRSYHIGKRNGYWSAGSIVKAVVNTEQQFYSCLGTRLGSRGKKEQVKKNYWLLKIKTQTCSAAVAQRQSHSSCRSLDCMCDLHKKHKGTWKKFG